ncbi:MAG: right-handed parallel beta-helix repeat-containing protein [Candidatus Bathyarchaeota archaeon]|nr:MAG: right-handed parallel beta-helix repeat-containing protein [Candidatus Bathyarchaeota archaeon]
MKKKASVYTFAIILLTLFSLKIINAETINFPSDYPTIQAAIDAAMAGDTILVASGTYYENLVIYKSLTLKGAGSDITIIDGGGTGTGVEITANNVNISGFTVRNSWDGVHLNRCNGTTLSNNKITLNRYDGIYVQSSSGNTISGNTITSNGLVIGSGLFIEYSSGNTISDNVIASNAYGEGVYLYHSSNNTVSGNTITLHINQPAISVEGFGNNTVSNNTISSNKLGIDLYETSDNTIVGNTISNNDDYGVDLTDSSDNIFYHNNFNNTEQVVIDSTYPTIPSINVWDNGAKGNYWSDYNGTGPYVIDDNNKDHNPLTDPYDETKPVADAGPDQLVVNGTTVTFDGSGSTDNLGIVNYGITNYTWTFTDNITKVLTGINPNYTFYNSGNFNVTLNVSDYSGNWDTNQMWVNVTETLLIRDVAITRVTAFPATVTTGDFFFINLTVTNEGNMSETFNVTVYYDSSVVGTKNVAFLVSGANETLSFNWNTTGVPGGNYTIKAVASILAGETDTVDNEGIGDKVTIRKLSSTVSVTVNPASVTVGSNITIRGAISPVRASVNVTIEYRPSDGNWTTLATVTTDSESKYSHNWTTTEPGSYEVKTSWEGDDNTLADESDVESATVKEIEKPVTDIYLYTAATAAIITVSAMAVYIFKVRKPKSSTVVRKTEIVKSYLSSEFLCLRET